MQLKNINLKIFNHYLQYLAVKFLEIFINILPIKLVYKLATVLGYFFYYICPIRKKVMLQNLKFCFNGYTEKQINAIGLKTYINICKSGFEYFFIKHLNKDNLNYFFRCNNIEYIFQSLKKNKGVIMLGAHLDNPEFVTNYLHLSGILCAALVKKQQNKFVHQLFEQIRKTHNIEIVYKGAGIKELFRILKKNKALATVADVAIANNEGMELLFLGHKTFTPIGPAKLAIHTGADIIPVFSHRNNDNTHTIDIFPPIYYQNLVSADENDKIKFIMQKYNDLLSEQIKKYPDNWFWLHRRWR